MLTDLFRPLHSHATASRSGGPTRWLACGLVLTLAACQSVPERPAEPSAPQASTPQPEPEALPALPSETLVVAMAPPPPAAVEPPTSLLPDMLAYSDRLRSLGQSELSAEQALIGDPGASAERLVKLALVLLASHQSSDTVRAISFLQRAASLNTPEAMALRPLVRLLSARLQEIRRLEEQLDRQTQQLREAQRRIDNLSDRLEAMRAIERSLLPRPARSSGGNPP